MEFLNNDRQLGDNCSDYNAGLQLSLLWRTKIGLFESLVGLQNDLQGINEHVISSNTIFNWANKCKIYTASFVRK